MKQCSVEGCENNAKSLGFCGKHYMRYKRNGDPEKTSPRMHGKSDSDIYKLWNNIRRDHNVSPEWESFMTFYNDVGDRPMVGVQLKKKDESLPYSKDNFQWYWTKSALETKEKWEKIYSSNDIDEKLEIV